MEISVVSCKIELRTKWKEAILLKGTIYGYVRVSTQEQNEARQLTAMREFGVEDK